MQTWPDGPGQLSIKNKTNDTANGSNVSAKELGQGNRQLTTGVLLYKRKTRMYLVVVGFVNGCVHDRLITKPQNNWVMSTLYEKNGRKLKQMVH